MSTSPETTTLESEDNRIEQMPNPDGSYEEIRYNADGNIETREIYDSEGFLTESTAYNADGSYEVSKYDEFEIEISKELYNANGDIVEREIYGDDDTREITRYNEDKSYEVEHYVDAKQLDTTLHYDSDNNLTEKNVYNADGDVICRTEYNPDGSYETKYYDENNDIVATDIHQAEEDKSTDRIQYYPDGSHEITEYNKDGSYETKQYQGESLISSATYDKDNNLIATTHYDKDGSSIERIFNENEVFEKTYYNSTGEPQEKITYLSYGQYEITTFDNGMEKEICKYDADNTLVQREYLYKDGSHTMVTYEHNENGKLSTATVFNIGADEIQFRHEYQVQHFDALECVESIEYYNGNGELIKTEEFERNEYLEIVQTTTYDADGNVVSIEEHDHIDGPLSIDALSDSTDDADTSCDKICEAIDFDMEGMFSDGAINQGVEIIDEPADTDSSASVDTNESGAEIEGKEEWPFETFSIDSD